MLFNTFNFYTFKNRIQVHATTLEQQISVWTSLVTKYHKQFKKSTCNINEDTELFKNSEINRELPLEGRVLVMEELAKRGLAECMDKKRSQWQIFWFTLDELGEMAYTFAIDNGMTNTVCTLFELSQGENTIDQEFCGIDISVMIKALQTLEAKGKCELILSDDIEGVKFF